MKVAVVNAGSSSLKVKLFDMQEQRVIASYLVEHIAQKGAEFNNHHDALISLAIDFASLDIIGHRVVHGAEIFLHSQLIDNDVLQTIEQLSSLAPLHNPANVEGIRIAMLQAPNIPHVAVFDTAFHSTMPQEAYLYALSYDMYKQHHIRRYGFHGTSHSYVAKEASKLLKRDLNELNLITLHLGNGASVCAIEHGKSIDTSMGFTPLEGLVMGSRSGDIDPSIVLYMQRELGMHIDEVDKELNKNSGLLGVCGKNDMREIVESSDEKCQLAFDIMIRRVQKYIGAYMALLGSVDAIVFTGGIGENSKKVRDIIVNNKMFSSLKVLVIKTDEELEIARECIALVEKR